jgi:hypothetical protein
MSVMPWAFSSWTRLLPIKPAPPVTINIFDGSPLALSIYPKNGFKQRRLLVSPRRGRRSRCPQPQHLRNGDGYETTASLNRRGFQFAAVATGLMINDLLLPPGKGKSAPLKCPLDD